LGPQQPAEKTKELSHSPKAHIERDPIRENVKMPMKKSIMKPEIMYKKGKKEKSKKSKEDVDIDSDSDEKGKRKPKADIDIDGKPKGGGRSQMKDLDLPVIEKSSHTRPLDIFVFQQNASGGFTITQEFISSAGIKNDLHELTLLPSLLANSQVTDKEMVWATVIALVVFERSFNDFRDEWELIYEKSKKFINSKILPHKITLSSLIDLVKDLLKL
jgi:hypothetical protein